MSSPERLGDNRRVFIAVVREFQGNTPNKMANCSDIDKSNTMNYAHARRNQSGIAPLDTPRNCLPRHGYAIPPPARFAKPRQRFSDSWIRILSCFISNGSRISFLCIFCIIHCNPTCPIADFHWIVYRYILWRNPRSSLQSEI